MQTTPMLLIKPQIAWHPHDGMTQIGNYAGVSKIRRKLGGLTLADYPRIASWWHPSKNGGKQPVEYLHRSNNLAAVPWL